MRPVLKPLEWIGRSRQELQGFPARVRKNIGFASYFAQAGDKHPGAKPLKGFGGAGVLDVVENFDGDSYRAVYTVTFAHAVYVLHAVQKKSKKGIGTPRTDIALVRQRLRIAERQAATGAAR